MLGLRRILAHPLIAGLDIDDPRVTEVRKEIIRRKKPFARIYEDRVSFEKTYPLLRVQEIKVLMPFRYLLTGGVSMRTLLPAFLFPAVGVLERALAPVMHHLGMFAFIVVEKSSK